MNALRHNHEALSGIGLAMAQHAKYAKALDDQLDFLLRDDNARKAMLHSHLLYLARARQRTQEPDDGRPSAGQLLGSLVTSTGPWPFPRDSRFGFAREIDRHENQVREAATGLSTFLEMDLFLDELEQLGAARRLATLATLSEGLGECPEGRAHLAKAVTHDPTGGGRLPALHLSRLADYEGDPLDDAIAVGKGVATAYTEVFGNVLPPMLETIDITALEQVLVRDGVPILGQFYNLDGAEVDDLAGFTGVVHEISEFERRNPGWLDNLQGGGAGFKATIGILDSWAKFRKLREEPSAVTSVAFGASMAGVVSDLSDVAERIAKGRGRDVRNLPALRYLRTVGTIGTNIDTLLTSVYAMDALAEGDESVALGHVAGLASGAAFVGAKAGGVALTAGAVSVWFPPAALAAVGAGLLIAGVYLVEFTKNEPPDPLLVAFRDNYFGFNWDVWELPTGHEETEFITSLKYDWKDRDGRPHIDRQLSALVGLFSPIVIQKAVLEEIRKPLGVVRRLRLEIQPHMAHNDAYVTIRVFNLNRHVRFSVFVLPVSPSREWELDTEWVDINVGRRENGEVAQWECDLNLTDEQWDQASWVEVGVTTPGPIPERLTEHFHLSMPHQVAGLLTQAPMKRAIIPTEAGE